MTTFPPIEITIAEKSEGSGHLSKIISLKDDGTLLSDGTECRMASGTLKRATLTSASDLGSLISTMPSNQALILGTLKEGTPSPINIVAGNGGVPLREGLGTRSQALLEFVEGSPGVILLDYDSKAMPPDTRDLIDQMMEGFVETLFSIFPPLRKAAHVIRASTSSGVINSVTGAPVHGSDGCHVYVFVKNVADVKRALDVAHARCALSGFGWIMPSRAGFPLRRSIIDSSVSTPERLNFEGTPLVYPPLVQPSIARQAVSHEGALLDTEMVFQDLTAAEQRAVDVNYLEQTKAMQPEFDRIKAAYHDSRVKKLREKGKTYDQIKVILEGYDRRELDTSFVLEFDASHLVGTTVGDVLADPAKFAGTAYRMADPEEGIEYGGGKAFVVYHPSEDRCEIHSYAHGGIIYKLIPDAAEEAPSAEDDFEAAEPPPDDSAPDIDIDIDVEPDAPKKPKRRLLTIADLMAMEDPKWLIHGMVPEQSLIMTDGPPKEGKTFLAVSMALHIAAGKPWFGREVNQGGVVYIAGEGSAGLKLRVQAMLTAYELEPTIPFWVVPSIVDFGDKKDVKALSDLVRKTVGNTHIHMVVIDTLARAMPGKEENSSSEMGVVIASCDWLKEDLGCTIMPIHHQGKDLTRGSRGSNAIAGALDALFRASRNKTESVDVVTLTNVYQKEAEETKPLMFDLTVSPAGGGRTSLVPTLRTAPIPGKADKGMSGKTATAFGIFHEVLRESGQKLPPGPNFPANTQGVQWETWRARFMERKPEDTKPESHKRALERAKDDLEENGHIAGWGGWYWERSASGADFEVEPSTSAKSDLDELMS